MLSGILRFCRPLPPRRPEAAHSTVCCDLVVRALCRLPRLRRLAVRRLRRRLQRAAADRCRRCGRRCGAPGGPPVRRARTARCAACRLAENAAAATSPSSPRPPPSATRVRLAAWSRLASSASCARWPPRWRPSQAPASRRSARPVASCCPSSSPPGCPPRPVAAWIAASTRLSCSPVRGRRRGPAADAAPAAHPRRRQASALDRAGRAGNVHGAFVCTRPAASQAVGQATAAGARSAAAQSTAAGAHTTRFPRVLIIDDVYTTGETLDECATALSVAGVRTTRVHVCANRPGSPGMSELAPHPLVPPSTLLAAASSRPSYRSRRPCCTGHAREPGPVPSTKEQRR